ncbi:MAG: alpha/beta fold hydrolase [Pseudomonadota bacterium]
MAQFVLVHGAWHAGWCWEKVVPRLEDRGHAAEVVDLPSHGANPGAKSTVDLDDYAQHVAETVRAQSAKPILVGHSMGGAVISQAAELAFDALHSLVYVCAFLPRNGERLFDYAGRDEDALVLRNMQIGEGDASTIPAEAAREVFYGACSDADAAAAIERLEGQGRRPLDKPLTLTSERFGSVPKRYVRCTEDRAISIAMQDEMRANWPMQKVLTLDTDHSPFYSAVSALADILIDAAEAE